MMQSTESARQSGYGRCPVDPASPIILARRNKRWHLWVDSAGYHWFQRLSQSFEQPGFCQLPGPDPDDIVSNVSPPCNEPGLRDMYLDPSRIFSCNRDPSGRRWPCYVKTLANLVSASILGFSDATTNSQSLREVTSTGSTAVDFLQGSVTCTPNTSLIFLAFCFVLFFVCFCAVPYFLPSSTIVF